MEGEKEVAIPEKLEIILKEMGITTMRIIQKNKWTGFLFVVYFIFLSWLILFKLQFDLSIFANMHVRTMNFIPFAASAIVNGKMDISEIILNIVVFIPFGLYVSMLDTKWNIGKKVVFMSSISLLYEILQYIFAIGGSDITDLIGNTFGGMLGIGLFFLLQHLLGAKTIKILNILATIGTVIVVLLVILLAVANRQAL